MTITATLVIGADGASVKNGTSDGVTNHEDRAKFLEFRKKFDCILIGGNTFRNEKYSNPPIPLFVISRSGSGENISPRAAIEKISKLYGENILVEAGPALLTEMIAAGLIDELHLTITQITGGDNPISFVELLRNFVITSDESVTGTRFISATKVAPHQQLR